MLLTAATTGAIPFLIQQTADDVFVGKNEQMVYWITAAIVVVTIIKAIAEYVADVTVAYLGNRFIADLRIQMFAKLARADLSWIQTVHSGRLLSGFLNDATLIRPDRQPLDGDAWRELSQGHHPDRHHVLHGRAFLGADPDLHADRLVRALAPAPQDAEIDHASRCRKPAISPRSSPRPCAACASCAPTGRRTGRRRAPPRPSTARSNSPCAARAPARCRAPRSSCLTGFGFALAIYFAGTKGVRGDLTPRPFHGLHDGGAADLRAAEERRHLADATAGRRRRGEPGVRRDRPSRSLSSRCRTPSRSSSSRARSSSGTCRSPMSPRTPC